MFISCAHAAPISAFTGDTVTLVGSESGGPCNSNEVYFHQTDSTGTPSGTAFVVPPNETLYITDVNWYAVGAGTINPPVDADFYIFQGQIPQAVFVPRIALHAASMTRVVGGSHAFTTGVAFSSGSILCSSAFLNFNGFNYPNVTIQGYLVSNAVK